MIFRYDQPQNKSQILHNKKFLLKTIAFLTGITYITIVESQNDRCKMFLKEVSNIRTGLVTARKQAKGPENGDFREYRLLSLRCIKEPGVLDVGLAEPYAANDELKPEYLTQQDDILVRLSAPYTAALVDDASADYVVPSHFAIIRVDKSKVDPAYVLWILRQQSTLKQIYQNVSGAVAFGTISSNFFNDLKIDAIPLEKQRLIGEILKLSEREQALLSELARAKAELNMAIMANAYKSLSKGK